MDEQPPLPADDSVGPTVLYVTFPLFALSVVAWAIRMWSRCRPKVRPTVADYFVTMAIVRLQLPAPPLSTWQERT